ncbi:unnamed protein product, partial [Owenia fusiformis]
DMDVPLGYVLTEEEKTIIYATSWKKKEGLIEEVPYVEGQSTINGLKDPGWICGMELHMFSMTYSITLKVEVTLLWMTMDNDCKWSLQYVYIPRINKTIEEFIAQWNNQGLRTEHMATPTQLFIQGALAQANSNLVAMRDIFAPSTVRSDLESEVERIDEDQPHVVVPDIGCPISPENFRSFQNLVDPLATTDDFGLSLFLQTLQFVRDHI